MVLAVMHLHYLQSTLAWAIAKMINSVLNLPVILPVPYSNTTSSPLLHGSIYPRFACTHTVPYMVLLLPLNRTTPLPCLPPSFAWLPPLLWHHLFLNCVHTVLHTHRYHQACKPLKREEEEEEEERDPFPTIQRMEEEEEGGNKLFSCSPRSLPPPVIGKFLVAFSP